MLFIIWPIFSLIYLPVLVLGDNEFIFPPPDGPDGGDSDLKVTIGDTARLRWTTTSTAPISLVAFQGPRNPPQGFYNVTLIGCTQSRMSSGNGHH